MLLHRSLLTLAVLGLFALAGCAEPRETIDAHTEDFRLIRDTDGTQIVRGSLVNPSDRRIAGAQLTVDLFEGPVTQDSRPVESMRIEVRDVDPQSTKPFRQEVDSGRALTGARVRSILLY